MKNTDQMGAADEESVQSRLDVLCDHFEQQCKEQKTPLIEKYLERAAEHERALLFADLLTLELDYFSRRNVLPPKDRYEQRFPEHHAAISRAFADLSRSAEMVDYGQSSVSSVEQALTITHISTGDSDPCSDAEEERLPDSLGPYAVEKQIGRGAFGSVYLGRKAGEATPVAIKVLRESSRNDPELREQFNREADALEEVSHPAVVSFVERFVTDDGTLCMATEYVAGGTLKGNLTEKRSFRDVAHFIADLADGLHALHLSGVTHRDVKPENILLDEQGRPRLADVGLALPDHAYGQGRQSVAGSLAYMSPEQARGDSHLVDGRADIYSLGVVMYQMLTGRRPFTADEPSELMRRIQQIAIKPPRQIDGTIPQSLEEVCLKATAKDPADRYATAADFAKSLRDACLQLDAPESSRLTRAALVALPLLVVLGLGLWIAGWDKTPGDVGELSIVQFDVQVSREKSQLVPLEDDDALRKGDGFRVVVELSRPAYAKLLWVDTAGSIVEFYPQEPGADPIEDPQPVTSFSSPALPDETWELGDPGGFSESLFLLVSDSPIADPPAPDVDKESPVGLPLDSVLRYRATPVETPRLLAQNRDGSGVRGGAFTGQQQRIEDPTLKLMDQLRKKVDEVRVLRIPMQYAGP